MNWSPWRVWLNPRSAFEDMADYARSEAELTVKLEEASLLLEQREKAVEELSRHNEDLRKGLEESETRITDMQKNLDSALLEVGALRNELSAHKSIDEKKAEIERELRKAEKMKASYEKRINELEARLADANIRLAGKDENEMIDAIDMVTGEKIRKSVEPEVKLQPAQKEKIQPSQKKEPAVNDDDDWLLELPDF